MSGEAPMQPWLTIIGVGDKGTDGLTGAALALLQDARTVIAPERVIAELDLPGKDIEPWTGKFHESVEKLLQRRGNPVTILATGDPMHFGVGATLARHIPVEEMRVLPSPSAFSLAAARLGWALQDTDCFSMHGRSVSKLALFLAPGNRILALTSNGETVGHAARLLVDRGFSRSELTVLEHMGGAAERQVRLVAEDYNDQSFGDFNTLAVSCVAGEGAMVTSRAAGLANDAFSHDGQITKREVRSASIGALMPYPGAVLWDIGAGCGTVSVEWMRLARGARAIAIEPREDRRAHIADNSLALGTPEIRIVAGTAPEALIGLERPDAVFIGGGVGRDGVFEAVWQALRPGGRLVANAVTLESEARLLALQSRHGGELSRISVARAEPVGPYHGWRPAMPVTMWSISKGAAT